MLEHQQGAQRARSGVGITGLTTEPILGGNETILQEHLRRVEARTPSFFSLRPMVRPGLPFSTTNAAIPAAPALGSVLAKITCRSAIPPLVMNCLAPLIR